VWRFFRGNVFFPVLTQTLSRLFPKRSAPCWVGERALGKAIENVVLGDFGRRQRTYR
jgi:hypothetical protein